MPGSELIDANCEIVLRDENLDDAGAVTEFTSFNATLRLNDVSSWQLEMHTADFIESKIRVGMGIMFYRDGVRIFDGPIMLIRHHFLAGAKTSTIVGGDNLIYLKARICYPVVSGMIVDKLVYPPAPILSGGSTSTPIPVYRFGKKRTAYGLTTTTAVAVAASDTKMTVVNASGFQPGATISIGGTTSVKIATIDYPQNILYFSGALGAWPIGTTIVQSGTNVIIDDPAFVGYDTRTGASETVMKELAYFNAGAGACVDQFGPRAWPHLVVAGSRGQGPEITINSRGDNLLTQMQNAALAGALFFDVTQEGNDLVLDTFQGNDLTAKSDLVFSVDAGNLKEYEVAYGLPEANFLLGFGPQPGVGKFMQPSADMVSISQFGRWESWDSASAAQAGATDDLIVQNMIASNALTLGTTAFNTTIASSLQETDQVRFPRDFSLGDKVRIMIGDDPTDQIVTTLAYSIPEASSSGMGSAITAYALKEKSALMMRVERQEEMLRRLIMNGFG